MITPPESMRAGREIVVLHVFTVLSKEKTTDPTIEARVRGRLSCCLLDGVRGMIEEL